MNTQEGNSVPEAIKVATSENWHRCVGKFGESDCGREGKHEWQGQFYCDECAERRADLIREEREAQVRAMEAVIRAQLLRKRPGRNMTRAKIEKRRLKEHGRRKENTRQRRSHG